jgi:murein DD-endopeptidase MepM/ murein hydrolase activator NlpD
LSPSERRTLISRLSLSALLTLPLAVYGFHAVRSALAPDDRASNPELQLAGAPGTAGYDTRTGADENVIPEPVFEVVGTVTVGSGGTLDSALARLGLEDPVVRNRASRALGQSLDLRRLSPKTGLTLAKDPSTSDRTLAVRAAADRFVRLSLTDDVEALPEVETVELPVVTEIRTAEGRVESSVLQALGGSDHPLQLTLAFSDVFQWDVDLLLDPRRGDELSIVYEERMLGDVPADLPPFGDAASRPGDSLGPGRILAGTYAGERASSTAFWVEQQAGLGEYYAPDGRPMRKSFLRSPLNYRRISSGFSKARRHPVTRKVVPHHGVDFAADSGTPVVAAADGRIVSAGREGPLGRAIRVRHNGEIVTVYGHLRGFAEGIRAGAQVTQNQVIGYVGATGRATGPHLHYTLLERGRPIDPMEFRSPPVEPLKPELRPKLELAKSQWAPLLATPMAELSEPRRGRDGA